MLAVIQIRPSKVSRVVSRMEGITRDVTMCVRVISRELPSYHGRCFGRCSSHLSGASK